MVKPAAHQLTAHCPTRYLVGLERAALVLYNFLATRAFLVCEMHARRTGYVIRVTRMRRARMSTRLRGTRTRVMTLYARSTWNGRLVYRAPTSAYELQIRQSVPYINRIGCYVHAYLLERTLQARWARAPVLPPFAAMVPARQRLTAHEIALVQPALLLANPLVVIDGRATFTLLRRHRKGCKWAAEPIALVFPACAESLARLIA